MDGDGNLGKGKTKNYSLLVQQAKNIFPIFTLDVENDLSLELNLLF